MQKKLLTNGNIFRRTDDRWGGTVWFSCSSSHRAMPSPQRRSIPISGVSSP